MKTILLAEDTQELRDLMGNALKRKGYNVIEAKNGMEALRLFKALPEIQAVVTDLEMPMANGTQLANGIREIDTQIPIIMWSGSDDPRNASVNLFVAKSDGSKPVIQALETLLNGPSTAGTIMLRGAA